MNVYEEIKYFQDIENIDDIFSIYNKHYLNLLEFTAKKSKGLYSNCYDLAHYLNKKLLREEYKQDCYFDTETHYQGSVFTFLILMGNPKELSGITNEALDLIKTSKLSVNIEELFLEKRIDKSYFLYSVSNQPLFDDVMSIAVFFDHTESVFGCIITQQDGRRFSRTMDFGLIHEILNERKEVQKLKANYLEERKLTDDANVTLEKIHNSIFFFAKFLLLLRCEKTPIYVDYLHPKDKKTNSKKIKKHGNKKKISYKKVSLTKEYREKTRCFASSNTQKLDLSDKKLKKIIVRGHIRLQPHGPGHELRKLIFIEEHESKTWVSKGIKQIKYVD